MPQYAKEFGHLPQDSEMVVRLQEMDWASTSLGHPSTWPELLRLQLNICFESAFPIAVWWGPDLIQFYNDGYRPILGASKHPAAFGGPALDTWPDIWPTIGPMVDQVVNQGIAVKGEDMPLVLDRNGYPELCHFTFSYSPIRNIDGHIDGMFTAAVETSERVRGEQQLLSERLRLQAIVETIPTGLIVMDEDGMLVIENDEWKRTWGGNAQVEGAVDYSLYKGRWAHSGEAVAPEKWPCFESLKEGTVTRDVIIDIDRFDGSQGTIVVSSAPIRDVSGRVIGAVAANMDISDLRAAELQLAEANRRKDDFLAMLAHELRNPLAPISSAAALLKILGQSDSRISKPSEVISRQVKHMSMLVDDLLDASRVTRGLVELDQDIVDLGVILENAVEQSKPLLDTKKHTLTVQLPGACPSVRADRHRLVQVFSNLLNNAAKYTPDGGSIRLSLRTTGSDHVVEIQDNGIGIEASLLPHIFDLFTQADRNPARADGGLGIGLALVEKIVALHGGEVKAYSAGPGAGSRFVVSLPLLQA